MDWIFSPIESLVSWRQRQERATAQCLRSKEPHMFYLNKVSNNDAVIPTDLIGASTGSAHFIQWHRPPDEWRQ